MRVDGVWGKKVACWWICYRFPSDGERLHLTSYLHYALHEKLLFSLFTGSVGEWDTTTFLVLLPSDDDWNLWSRKPTSLNFYVTS